MIEAPSWLVLTQVLLGLVSTTSALVIAWVALVLQRRTNMEEREAQRLADRQERLWQQQASLYVDVLRAIWLSDEPESDYDKAERHKLALIDLGPMLIAFAPRELLEAVNAYLTSCNAFTIAFHYAPEDRVSDILSLEGEWEEKRGVIEETIRNITHADA